MDDTDVDMEDIYLPPLLSLPLEILQLIQYHMDVGTFFISLLTCKRFLVAAASRPLVLQHLRNMPGLDLGLDALDHDQLLIEFRKRAAESGRAAGVLAHTLSFGASPGCLMSKSTFTPHDPVYPRSKHMTVAVPHSSEIIQLYELFEDRVCRKEELHIRHEDGNENRMDILKMAFAPGSRDLAVLCYQKESIRYRPPQCFTPEKLGGQGIYYKLIVFHRLNARQRGHFYSSHIQETRDVALPKYLKIVAVALAPNGIAGISLHNGRPNGGLNAWLVTRNSEMMQSCTYDPDPRLYKVEGTGTIAATLVSNLNFVEEGRMLELFEAGHYIPGFYSYIKESGEQESPVILQAGNAINLHKDGRRHLFSIGTPFYEHHTNRHTLDSSSETRCARSQLALGFTDNKKDPSYPSESIFIMQSEYFTQEQDCSHLITYDNGRSSNRQWKPIALLAGYKQSSSTLGTVAAISPDGTRVAAAIWDRVYLWSFNPRLMLEGELHLYFPPHDFNGRKGFGRLRPTLLPNAGGVVHGMLWTNEENLFAITVRRTVECAMLACVKLLRCSMLHKSSSTRLSERLPMPHTFVP